MLSRLPSPNLFRLSNFAVSSLPVLQKQAVHYSKLSDADAAEIMAMDEKYILPLYGRGNFVFTHGEGTYLYTHDNKKFMDCFSGVAVMSLGHSDPEWVAAVQDQVGKLAHLSNYHHNEWAAPLAKKLVSSCHFADKVFYCNTGAEATEAALKLTRKAAKAIDPTKTEIVSFRGSFHGRTVGALSMTYKEAYRAPFLPLLDGIHFADFNNIEQVKNLISDKTAAVILEPIQGEGGINVASQEFLRAVRELCDKHNAFLIFDEVQCGLARTGHLWAHHAYKSATSSSSSIEPDVLAFAKPIAGGIPMGGALLSKKIVDQIHKGDHGTTFGGGPLACRAATVMFDRLSRPELLSHVQKAGEFIQQSLKSIQSDKVVEVRGRGLLIGVELTKPVAPLQKYVMEKGFLMINAGDKVLRLCPPLTIDRQQQEDIVSVIKDGLNHL